MKTWDQMMMSERDEFVAEKVMGLVGCPHYRIVNFGSAGGAALMKDDDECTCPREHYSVKVTSNLHGIVGGCPMYTTDIARAWDIVEKMISRGYSFDLRTYVEGSYGPWHAQFYGPGNESDSEPNSVMSMMRVFGAARSEDAPEAICLAALRARSAL
jgi:hypothetical protein